MLTISFDFEMHSSMGKMDKYLWFWFDCSIWTFLTSFQLHTFDKVIYAQITSKWALEHGPLDFENSKVTVKRAYHPLPLQYSHEHFIMPDPIWVYRQAVNSKSTTIHILQSRKECSLILKIHVWERMVTIEMYAISLELEGRWRWMDR